MKNKTKKFINNKYVQIVTLYLFAILDYEFLFCNATFFGNIIRKNFDFSLYVFSFARIFLYLLIGLILFSMRNRLVNNRLEYENARNKKIDLTNIIIILIQMIIIGSALVIMIKAHLTIMSLGVVILLLLYLAFIYLFHSNNYKLNILMICTVSLILCTTTDSIHPIDEMIHFTSSYNEAHGNFNFDRSFSDPSLDSIAGWGNFNVNQPLHVHYIPNKYEVTTKTERWPSSGSKYLYLPSALGIFVSQHLNGTIMDTFYMGRIFNSLVMLAGIALLLKMLKYKSNCFIAVITTPYFLLMGSTYNVDGIGGISVLLFITYVLNLYFDKNIKKLSWKNLLIMLILSLLIVLFKSGAYLFVFVLLLCLVKKVPKKLYYVLIPLALIVGYVLYKEIVPSDLSVGDSRGGNTSMGSQLQFLLSSPIVFCKVYLLHTLNNFFNTTFYSNLNDTFFFSRYSNYLTLIYFLYLLMMGFSSEENDKNKNSILFKLFLLVVFCLNFYFTSTGLYLSFTEVGSYIINGYQARYVFPIMALLLCCIQNKYIKINMTKNEIFNVVVVVDSLFVILAIFSRMI